MKLKTTLLLIAVLLSSAEGRGQQKQIDLSGTWQFALDRQSLVHPDYILTETVQLPGTTDTNKKGDFIAKSEETTHLTLKDDAVKVLHSICQQIWKTQQWPQDWKRSVFISVPKKSNAKECSNHHFLVTQTDRKSVV